MTVDRRFFLKDLVLGGAAGLLFGRSERVLAGVVPSPVQRDVRPTLALVGSDTAGSAFLQGARVAAGVRLQVQRASPDPGFMRGFAQQLRVERPSRVMGLLDDASAVLVLDLARSAGARVHWLGQHSADAGSTRHRLLNTDLAEGCARQLGRQLHACGTGFTLDEERQGSTAPARRLAGPPRNGAGSAQWASSVGYLLASLGMRPVTVPRIPAPGALSGGSWVSFSIEV